MLLRDFCLLYEIDVDAVNSRWFDLILQWPFRYLNNLLNLVLWNFQVILETKNLYPIRIYKWLVILDKRNVNKERH